MTDNERPTMEQEARRHAASIEADIERLTKLRALNDAGRCADEVVEELESELQDSNYGAGVTITVDVQMYGGGPAGGIEFECQRGDHGLEMLRADVWHQDWFEQRGRHRLDDDAAEFLFQLWGLDYMMEGG